MECGFKFRRQHPVGRFILDFYCPVCQLVIELDGAIHDNQTNYDADRTKYLETYGYKVLRFQNEVDAEESVYKVDTRVELTKMIKLLQAPRLFEPALEY
ncbi:DUF559 domain-containing protein [Nostoc sp. HG1]|nr:DUF559 domain-containing protein [Nostoc sp. HG1]